MELFVRLCAGTVSVILLVSVVILVVGLNGRTWGNDFFTFFLEDSGEFIEICYFVVLSPFVIWYGWTRYGS